jgi:cytochrome c553
MLGAAALVAAISVIVSSATGAVAKPSPLPTAAAVCQGCHGAQGEGNAAVGAPRIAGQSAHYLEKQLRDYASGARENAVMLGIAKALSDADRTGVAAFYSTQKTPFAAAGIAPGGTQLARGHELAHQGAEAVRVQACDNCHGPDGSGVPYSAPYLAGQSAAYLATQLKLWKQGTRKNDAGKLMASVAVRLDDADIAAVTAYYASLTDR